MDEDEDLLCSEIELDEAAELEELEESSDSSEDILEKKGLGRTLVAKRQLVSNVRLWLKDLKFKNELTLSMSNAISLRNS